MSDEVISTLFAVAMAVDAVVGLIIGSLFDKFRLRILFLVPFFVIPISIFAFVWESLISVVISVVLWGIVMGFHETVMKSAIAVIVPMEKRGLAYGIFHSLFGVAWFVGGLAIGRLYEISIFYLIVFSVGLQALSLICFVWLKRARKIF